MKLKDIVKIEEKWDVDYKVSPSEKGKYDGMTVSELESELKKLKDSGPHEMGTAAYGKMKELMFAIRAKTGWGSVSESQNLNESLTVWIVKDPSTGEFRVPAPNGKESGAYYTDDKEDAMSTAEDMYKNESVIIRFKSGKHPE